MENSSVITSIMVTPMYSIQVILINIQLQRWLKIEYLTAPRNFPVSVICFFFFFFYQRETVDGIVTILSLAVHLLSSTFLFLSIRIPAKNSASPLEPLTPIVLLPAARMTRSKNSLSSLFFFSVRVTCVVLHSVALYWTTTTRQVVQQQSPRQKLPLSIGILFGGRGRSLVLLLSESIQFFLSPAVRRLHRFLSIALSIFLLSPE